LNAVFIGMPPIYPTAAAMALELGFDEGQSRTARRDRRHDQCQQEQITQPHRVSPVPAPDPAPAVAC
jgi:3-polyprenyl-4-hydroxybenzoate decarboxylase